MIPQTSRTRFAAVAVLALAVYAAGTHRRVFAAGNDASRWAHIESLVDFGTPAIEGSHFAATVDRVEIAGHAYSNKPPLLALAGAALYAPLAAVTGWRLGDPATAGRVIWWLTVLLVGLPGALTVALADRALGRAAGLGPAWRTLLTGGLAVGTLLLPFAVTFTGHVPAACLLLLAVLATFDGRAAWAGIWASLSAAIDLLPGLGCAPFLALALAAEGRREGTGPGRPLARFAAGSGVGLALAVAGNLATTGSPLPPKLVPGAVDMATAAGPSAAGVVLPESPLYPLEILFGGHGLFTVSPILLVAAIGLALATLRPPFGARLTWRLLALAIAAQIAGHALIAGSYGGWSYGYRYLVPIQPLLVLATPAALAARAGRLAWGGLLPVAVLFAALGAYHPWPPAYEQASSLGSVSSMVRNPIGGNAAAWAAAHLPGGALAESLGARYIHPDPALRRRYLQLFFATKGDRGTLRKFGR